MPGAFLTNDLPTFFTADEFGEGDAQVVWKGTPIADCIFDNEDVEFAMGEGVSQIAPQPTITGKSADFAGIADGDTIVVRGETYHVKNWQDDATGVIEIFLEQR